MEQSLISLGFKPVDALRIAARGAALPDVREVLTLCTAAASVSGREVAPAWGGTVHGLAAAFIERGTPFDQVRAVLRESIATEPAVDVWAQRAALMQ